MKKQNLRIIVYYIINILNINFSFLMQICVFYKKKLFFFIVLKKINCL